MSFGIAVPAAVSAAAAPVVIVIIGVPRPGAGEPALVVPRGHITAAIVIVVAIAAARPATLFPSATRGFRVTFGIGVPATVSAVAPPIVVIVIVITRPRAREPTFLVPGGHSPAIIVAIAAARALSLIPAAA